MPSRVTCARAACVPLLLVMLAHPASRAQAADGGGRASPKRPEVRLKEILYGEHGGLYSVPELDDLRGPSRDVARRLIAEALKDEGLRADPFACARAIVKYRAFESAHSVKRYFDAIDRSTRAKREEASARLLRAIAMLSWQDRKTAEFCAGRSSDRLRRLLAVLPSDESDAKSIALAYLDTLWAVGGERALVDMRDEAAKKIESRSTNGEDELTDELLLASDVTLLVEGGARDRLELLPLRERIVALKGDEARHALARCIIDRRKYSHSPLVLEWLDAYFAQCTTVESSSRYVRAALKELLGHEGLPPVMRTEFRQLAYEWLDRKGNGLTPKEAEDRKTVAREIGKLALRGDVVSDGEDGAPKPSGADDIADAKATKTTPLLAFGVVALLAVCLLYFVRRRRGAGAR